MSKYRFIVPLLFLLSPCLTVAQNMSDLYKRADNYSELFTSKYYNGVANVKSIDNSPYFTYQTNTRKGTEYYLIDADKKVLNSAFNQERLANALSVVLNKKVEPYKLPISQVVLNKQLDSLFFRVKSKDYHVDLNNYSVKEKADEGKDTSYYWGSASKEDSKEKVTSPDGKKDAYISEGNLWVEDKTTGKKTKLSNDGSPSEYYSSNIYWSPDSKKIVSFKYRPGGDRKLLLISSSPKDQLQPKTETWDYAKPGDAVAIRRPVAFLVEENRAIHFTLPEAEMQYNTPNIRWNKESDSFTFDFNRRGHQQYIVYHADLSTSKLRPIVDEKSNTFIYYREVYKYWLEDKNEMLWISERDGWRHIYLIDTQTGNVKKQLTKGNWLVKTIVNVDEEKRTLLFKACGMDNGEDPYLEKYYSLNIDNGKIVCLTPENANHLATFTTDYQYMLDSYSRVDIAPTVVVRSLSKDGEVVFKPENQPNIEDVKSAGWKAPEVFTAKGRDGETDIWGIIIRPTHFDPNKKYPVIEYIYAGPHNSFVPKSFGIEHHGSALAELGFIVVQIDGMGTANRSKAFHDVCWKNLKDAGFPDRIKWIEAAATKYPEMDIAKVGIYGTSAGGQSSMGALLFYPEFYKVAVSSCGCHDNRIDKMWWNEQWMGYPIGQEYIDCSNVENAHLLEGDLMLILGEMDNNVDPASTLQVVDKLIEHNKEFEFVMIPGEGHSSGGKYGERKRRDFFVKHLMNVGTPTWNNKE